MQDSAATRFKKKLRTLRKARGWTQEIAAEKCGIGYKLFQLYELGIKQNPGLLTLEKIGRGFGLDISELLAPSVSKKPLRAKKPRLASVKPKK